MFECDILQILKATASSKEEWCTIKFDFSTGQYFITQVNCCSGECTPSANLDASRFNQEIILFLNKCNTYPEIIMSLPPYFTYICHLNSSSMRTPDLTLKVWKVFQVHIGSAGLLK